MDCDAHNGFDDEGKRVPITDFDFGAVERDNPAETIAQLESRIEFLERDVAYYKSKTAEVAHLIFDTLLAGSPIPSAEEIGRRALFFDQLVFDKPQFESQAKLADHLRLSGARVSQELKAFKARFPAIPRAISTVPR